MDFKPPIIRHINDVLPHIKGKNEIIHIEKDDYSVLDYVYVLADTFDNPYASECRGLKFDKDGNLIARPYHKFKNLGEDQEYSTTRVDLSLPHVILDKLDGSMVHNCVIRGRHTLMTRKGQSEVALSAEDYFFRNKERQVRYSNLFNNHPYFTFIFEYVGPNNKIVIDYEEEDLILTGIRHTEKGAYIPYPAMKSIAREYYIPVVDLYNPGLFSSSKAILPSGRFIEVVSADKEKEGCIIRFDSGAMVKMKSDIYVRKHRSKDLVTKFKDLVKLIINDELDDVLPQLDEETRDRVVEYRDNLISSIIHEGRGFNGICNIYNKLDQKSFALKIKELYPNLTPMLFGTRKSGDGIEEIKRCIQRAYSDTQRLTALFEELDFPIWKGDFFSTEE